MPCCICITPTVDWSGLWYISTESVSTKCLFFPFLFLKKAKQIWSSRWGLRRVTEGKWSTNSIWSLMPNAMPGELGPGWRRGAAKDKALLQGGGREVRRIWVTSSFRNDFKENLCWGFGWSTMIFFFFFLLQTLVWFVKKTLEMSCGNLQCENSANTHQQSTGALMILEVPDI